MTKTKIFFSDFSYIYVCLHACMHIMCLLSACKDQKKESDSLELDLRVVANHYVGGGNQIWVS